MQDKSQFNELIVAYLAEELNAEDAAFVEQWINHDQKNREYFEEFKAVWSVLNAKEAMESIDSEKEWKRFKESIAVGIPTAIDAEPGILPAERKHESKAVYYKIALASVAAVVILVLGLRLGVFNGTKQDIPAVPERAAITKVDSTAAKRETNFSGEPRQLELEDGTKITLYGRSEIVYHYPFRDSRVITLIGKAYFDVVKDKTKPFTVYSGDIATTVLGTKFTITAFEDARNIMVRLYEGRVAVSAVDGLGKKRMSDFYLTPGQELLYINNTGKAVVRRFETNDKQHSSAPTVTHVPDEAPSVPLEKNGTWYMFNNQSLAQVFDQLQTLYDIKIEYNADDVSNMYFIGRFDKKDPPEKILNRIAVLNNLTVTKTDDQYIIKK